MKPSGQKIMDILQNEPDLAYVRRARVVLENINLPPKGKVLEIGCGRGFYLRAIRELFPSSLIWGVDLNEQYLNLARRYTNDVRTKLLRADATNLPFQDNTYDLVIASEILEHIPDDQGAIEEMFRVLKPGGVALVTVPNKNYPFCWDPLNWVLERLIGRHIPSNIWWLSGIWAGHVRLYGSANLKGKLVMAGFKVDKVSFTTHYCLPFSHFLLYGVGKNLVEKGFAKSLNRFTKPFSPRPWIVKVLLWPIKKIDSLNKKNTPHTFSVNLFFKAIKPLSVNS